MKMDKDLVRRLVFAFRDYYSKENLDFWSKQICEKIINLDAFKNSKNIAFYYPKKGEVDIRPAIGKALLERKRVFLPKSHMRDRTLTFHQIFSLSNVVPGPFKLLEPPADNPEIKIENLDAIFVPGVAFDIEKGRLGYGWGFYDRVLGKTKAVKIGIAFSFQVFHSIPYEPHDQRVDIVVTENKIYF